MTETRIGPLGLSVGQRARRTKTITAKGVELYAEITGDRNPLHFDASFAGRTRFKRLVAQGGITSGMLNALVAMDLPGPGTVFLHVDWNYRAPVRPGDTITGEVIVTAVREDKPIIELDTRVVLADGTVVLDGHAVCYTMPLPRR